MKPCTNCGFDKRRLRRGLCDRCDHYLRRTGKMRPPQGCGYTRNKGQRCKRCRLEPARANGLCAACNRYQTLHGIPRPRWLWNREQCSNCKRPKNKNFRRGRCLPCWRYWNKHGTERPQEIIPRVEWCDCGQPAIHLNVPLTVGTGDGYERTERYNLCGDCWQLEQEPILTRHEAVWNR